MSEGLKESVGLERDRKERKGKGQRGWSRRKDGNKREEEEEEEMRRGEREEEEEEGNTKTTLTSAGWSYTRSIDSFLK